MLYSTDFGQEPITSAFGVDINGLDKYTDIALIFQDGTQATFSSHTTKSTSNIRCGTPTMLFNGSSYIPATNYCRLDRYPNRLWFHEVYNADMSGNVYTEGRAIVGIIGIR